MKVQSGYCEVCGIKIVTSEVLPKTMPCVKRAGDSEPRMLIMNGAVYCNPGVLDEVIQTILQQINAAG